MVIKSCFKSQCRNITESNVILSELIFLGNDIEHSRSLNLQLIILYNFFSRDPIEETRKLVYEISVYKLHSKNKFSTSIIH